MGRHDDQITKHNQKNQKLKLKNKKLDVQTRVFGPFLLPDNLHAACVTLQYSYYTEGSFTYCTSLKHSMEKYNASFAIFKHNVSLMYCSAPQTQHHHELRDILFAQKGLVLAQTQKLWDPLPVWPPTDYVQIQQSYGL